MSRNECDGCGLAACDLPDGVDPDLIFEGDGRGNVYCQGCASSRPAPVPVEEFDGGAEEDGNFDEAHDWLVEFLMSADASLHRNWARWSAGEISREEFERLQY